MPWESPDCSDPVTNNMAFDVHVTVHNDRFLTIKPTICTNFSKFLFWNETLLVSDSSSLHHQEFALYTQQCYMPYIFADSLRAGSGWNCSLY